MEVHRMTYTIMALPDFIEELDGVLWVVSPIKI
jgi:hypothetical protein